MIYSKIFLNRDKEYHSKPEVRFGNYFFCWSKDVKVGLVANEINAFRNFVKKMIPIVEQYMIFLIDESKAASLNTSIYQDKKKLMLEEKYNSFISFLIFVDINGKTTFYRQEKCELISYDDADDKDMQLLDKHTFAVSHESQSHSKKLGSSLVEVKWLLGELLFNRTNKSR